jgi:D-serine deaminase-like pyridoxal phosphate-dependent protein
VIDVFVEIDVGQGRCGVPPGAAAVDAGARDPRTRPCASPACRLTTARPSTCARAQARRDAIGVVVQDVLFTRKQIEAEGVPVDLVTGAGTGSMVCEAASGVFGELQAGSFLFMDADYAKNERDPAQPQFEHALFVKSQVMSSGGGTPSATPATRAMPSIPACRWCWPWSPTGELEYGNGGDEHGILRPAGANQRLPGWTTCSG